MGQRVVRRINLQTGEVETYRAVTASSSMQERLEALAASIGEHTTEPALASFMAVWCDGCGHLVYLSEPKLPAGWATTPAGELCPDCQE
jgi:hypothetical protein